LTGAIFAKDRYAVNRATKRLENAAGTWGSGTNDKAGSVLNLLRWVSPRTIKETLVPAKDYTYPFLEKDLD
jgi:1-pyrroline-5-carboxylate dehydrogenase